MVKVYTRFQTKTAQKPTRWGGTYLYGLYKGVPPPRLLKLPIPATDTNTIKMLGPVYLMWPQHKQYFS